MPWLSWVSTLKGRKLEGSGTSLDVPIAEKLLPPSAHLPQSALLLSAFVLGSASTGAAVYIYVRYIRRIPNAEWVTPAMLARKRWIKGYVTSVGDADNFRLYHTPGIGWRWPFKFRRIPKGRDLKDQTIHIRLAGVDAPEAAHFGRPAQAFSEESLAWLKGAVESRTVYCQLLRRDQYGRIVAHPYLPPRILPGWLLTGPFIPLEMLRAGWVTVYEQSGAEYGDGGKEGYLRVQAEAQATRRGIWQYGINEESPAQYKRRYASGQKPQAKAAQDTVLQRQATYNGWLSRTMGWIRRK